MAYLLGIVVLFNSWKLKIVITSIAIEIFLQAFLIYSSAYLWSAIEETEDATEHFLFARANSKSRGLLLGMRKVSAATIWRSHRVNNKLGK